MKRWEVLRRKNGKDQKRSVCLEWAQKGGRGERWYKGGAHVSMLNDNWSCNAVPM